MSDGAMMSLEQAARWLGKSEKTIKARLDRAQLPIVRDVLDARRKLVAVADVEKLKEMEARTSVAADIVRARGERTSRSAPLPRGKTDRMLAAYGASIAELTVELRRLYGLAKRVDELMPNLRHGDVDMADPVSRLEEAMRGLRGALAGTNETQRRIEVQLRSLDEREPEAEMLAAETLDVQAAVEACRGIAHVIEPLLLVLQREAQDR